MQNPPPLRGYRPPTVEPSAGAFAVPATVTWEDGSAGDDLEVVAPGPSARAGQLPTRSMHRTPVAAPVSPAPQQPAAPVAAPILTPPLVQFAAPAPAAPWSTTTVEPAPALAAPIAPAPPVAPPIHTRTIDADQTAPSWTRITATPEGEPQAASEWAVAPPPAFNVPFIPEHAGPVPVQPADHPPTVPAKDKRLTTRKGRASKPVAPTKRKASAASPHGRGAWLAIRITIAVITAWLLLVGLKHAVIGSKVPTTDEVATQVSAKIGFNGFPRAAGESFATRFAAVYLTYNQAGNDKRAKELAQYAPNATTFAWGWNGSGAQKVVAGPAVAGDPELLDKNNAIVTVAAKLDRGYWVYLAVPVYANGKGAMVVSGPPAFTSAPRVAISPGKAAVQDLDGALSASITPDMVGFFTAWAASDSTALSRYTTTDATIAATTGLGGVFTLNDLRVMRIPTAGGNTRQGEMDVDWSAPGGGQMMQSYRVVIQKLDTGRWFVKDIKGGLVAPPSNTGIDPNAPATK